jgi:methionyl-tRNA formyltransferase
VVTGEGAEPTRLVLVSGHVFGLRAFEGIFSSPARLGGRIEVPLMIGLDASHAAGTVGYRSLAGLAAEQGAEYVSTGDGRLGSLAGLIRAARPSYLLVIGWSRLIPESILSIPAAAAAGDGVPAGGFGCIGMHPTKLPDGRGQAPIPWTIIKGCTKTALSVFFLEAEADSGPLIAQYGLDVHPREDAASLFHRMAGTHFTAGLDLAEGLGRRSVAGQPQDHAVATRWPKRRPADGEIHASMTCQQIDALVRALLGPYPRAFVTDAGSGARRYIRGVRRLAGPEAAAPGLIRFGCADGTVGLAPEPGPQPPG